MTESNVTHERERALRYIVDVIGADLDTLLGYLSADRENPQIRRFPLKNTTNLEEENKEVLWLAAMKHFTVPRYLALL